MGTPLKDEVAELALFKPSGERFIDEAPFGKMLLTPGCRYLKNLGATWLFDLIYSYEPMLKGEEFLSVKVKRLQVNKFVIMLDDRQGNTLALQEVTNDDFVLDAIEVWLHAGIMMLPSEF